MKHSKKLSSLSAHGLIVSLVLSLALSGCGANSSETAEKANFKPLPASWLVTDRDQTSSDQDEPIEVEDGASGVDAENSVDQVLAAQSEAIESNASSEIADQDTQALHSGKVRPKDWTPWGLKIFITELGVSLSGWVGALINKGTPSVVLVWRKQYPVTNPASSFVQEAQIAPQDSADLVVRPDMTTAEMQSQLEPAIRAALGTRRIKNEKAFRENVLSAAADFQRSASTLESVGSGSWWVSRFRADFSVDVTGKLTPVASVGGEVKLRFEWHRLMPKPGTIQPVPKPLAQSVNSSFMANPRFNSGLVQFADTVAKELEAAAEDSLDKRGFKAYSYRVGLGVSSKGDIGIAQTTSTLFAHLYFSRDVKKPVINPKPVTALAAATQPEGTLNLISDSSDPARLSALQANGTSYERVTKFSGAGDDLVIQVKKGRFRRGLRKSLRIGQFFAKRVKKMKTGKWKVYELKTGFEMSVAGNTGVAKVNALGATEIVFYNQGF